MLSFGHETRLDNDWSGKRRETKKWKMSSRPAAMMMTEMRRGASVFDAAAAGRPPPHSQPTGGHFFDVFDVFWCDRWRFQWLEKKSAQKERPPRRAIVAPSNGRSHSNWQLLWFPLFRRGGNGPSYRFTRSLSSLFLYETLFWLFNWFALKFIQIYANECNFLLEKFVN